MKKVFLIGYYGYDNLGDDLLLFEIVERLKKHNHFEISALSFDAKKISTIYGVKGISRLKNFSIVRHIMSVDVVVCGGGSILQDKTSSKSLYYYMSILFLAKLFGKKIYLIGNGYGPIDKSHNRLMVSTLLKLADGIIARDEQAYECYRAIGVKNLHNGVDCAFLGELAKNGLQDAQIFEDYKKQQGIVRPYVLFTIRNWEGFEKLVPELEKTISHLDRRGYDSCFLSMKLPEDDVIGKRYFEGKAIFLKREMSLLPFLFSNAQLTIGMRLHGIILSAMYRTPFVAIPYDPKVESFVKQCEQLSTRRVEIMQSGELLEVVETALERKGEYQTLLERKIPVFEQMAEEEFDLFLRWIS